MTTALTVVIVIFVILFVVVPIGLVIYSVAFKFYIWLLDMFEIHFF